MFPAESSPYSSGTKYTTEDDLSDQNKNGTKTTHQKEAPPVEEDSLSKVLPVDEE